MTIVPKNISIVPTTDAHIAGLNRCLDAVASERRYIGLVEGTTLAQSQEFVRRLIEGGGVQFVAVDGAGPDGAGTVVGWCDIARPRLEGFRHCGRLGMGLLAPYRGLGLGRRLAETAIAAAREGGAERIELEVFGSNVSAIALYERLGFVRDGVKRNARKLDGDYDDVVMMSLMP
jgi:ribosomal protein S18 acetylase RimI-like enzyme